ncbi:MAG: acyltransferase [Sphingobacteriaceae bacterium]|nr:MAG: acyltransferase [Sphingobacteriaceae bacterium]
MPKLVTAIFAILPKGLLVFLYDAVKPFSQKFFLGIRYCILKNLCSSVGDKVIIGSNVTFKNWAGISIGSNVSIHDGCYVEGYGGITIGKNVSIAHQCSLLSTSHTWNDRDTPIRLNPVEKQPLTIKNNVWIGCGVRILGGVTIGSDSIVGAGSIVTKTLPKNGIYKGSPAKFYKAVYPPVNAKELEFYSINSYK